MRTIYKQALKEGSKWGVKIGLGFKVLLRLTLRVRSNEFRSSEYKEFGVGSKELGV